MAKEKKQKISFRATKIISKPVEISFQTKSGKAVSFKANKDVPKSVKVIFYANKKKNK